jgi:tetratricopeptide (TPR) repeat protein
MGLENRWALRQGAIALLPKLNAQNLSNSVKQIGEALGSQVEEEALRNVIKLMQPDIVEASIPVTAPEIALQAANSGFNRALELHKAGTLELAKEELGIVIRINPRNDAAFILRGDIYINLNQFQFQHKFFHHQDI